MSITKDDLLAFMLRQDALTFGDFMLKSGRQSPYFFNSGTLQTGSALTQLACMYADCIKLKIGVPDVVFGPAYKGIPLAVATACVLAQGGHDVGYCFNRKEKKDHGEGGTLVGKPPTNNSVVLDDVLTAGTAISETLTDLGQHGIKPRAVIVLLDRQEHNNQDEPATTALSKQFGVPVYALITLDDVIAYAHSHQLLTSEEQERMARYRAQFV